MLRAFPAAPRTVCSAHLKGDKSWTSLQGVCLLHHHPENRHSSLSGLSPLLDHLYIFCHPSCLCVNSLIS